MSQSTFGVRPCLVPRWVSYRSSLVRKRANEPAYTTVEQAVRKMFPAGTSSVCCSPKCLRKVTPDLISRPTIIFEVGGTTGGRRNKLKITPAPATLQLWREHLILVFLVTDLHHGPRERQELFATRTDGQAKTGKPAKNEQSQQTAKAQERLCCR